MGTSNEPIKLTAKQTAMIARLARKPIYTTDVLTRGEKITLRSLQAKGLVANQPNGDDIEWDLTNEGIDLACIDPGFASQGQADKPDDTAPIKLTPKQEAMILEMGDSEYHDDDEPGGTIWTCVVVYSQADKAVLGSLYERGLAHGWPGVGKDDGTCKLSELGVKAYHQIKSGNAGK